MYAERVPPHDLEAEEAVLGSLVIDGESITKISPFLNSTDFYRDRNRWCYEACQELFRRGDAIDQATIGHELSRSNRLEDVGGHAFLSQVAAVVPTSVNVEHYARIVQRTSLMRQVITAASEIAALGYGDGSDVETTISQAEDILFQIRRGHSTRDFFHIREVLDRYLEDTAAAAAGPLDSGSAPIPSGFSVVDQLLGGLQRSDLVIIAGRPAMGKSSLALNIVRNAAQLGSTAAVFSLEMSREQLVLRLVAGEAQVDSHRLRLGLYTESEERRVVDAVGALSDLAVYIDDNPLLTIVDVRSKARRLHLERGIDLIVVDYLQLIEGGTGRGQNRVQEIGEITRALKGLARDLNVPVIAVSQLSRAVETRPSHRPMLSDLRESGSIEQDADVVMFIYRDDVYFTEEDWEQRYPDRPYPRNLAEIIVAKHRHGPVGTVRLHFRDALAQFIDLPAGQGAS
ncbi:MAG: replicative DNA helicase [SAR202 cluster bacterium]|nr:replicative DNA helicase [SAR202 cluster bacterium]